MGLAETAAIETQTASGDKQPAFNQVCDRHSPSVKQIGGSRDVRSWCLRQDKPPTTITLMPLLQRQTIPRTASESTVMLRSAT